jgi:hypothetical protein
LRTGQAVFRNRIEKKPELAGLEQERIAGMNVLEIVFVVTAFTFQVALIIHFALRKWFFAAYIMKFGWIMYALSVPAALVSLFLLKGGMAWSFWVGGFIFLIWAIYGYNVEYRMGIQWRNPMRWSIFGPYILLYLATVLFYWWPLALIRKPLWYAGAALFTAGTILNITSHKDSQKSIQ